MTFRNRKEAGVQLATALKAYKNNKDAVVLAVPRGGVVLGYEIARKLNLPMEIELIRKIGHPLNPELAVGAVSLKGRIINEYNVTPYYVEAETDRIREFLANRYRKYKRKLANWKGKNIIIVDDGVATGSTILATVELVKADGPKKIIVAVPVGPLATLMRIKEVADEVICLERLNDFYAVSEFYSNFDEVTDRQVIELLKGSRAVSPV